MKKCCFIIIVLSLTLSASCSNGNDSDLICSDPATQETIIPDLSITTSADAETTSAVLSDYPIEPLSVDMSFFETTEGINNTLGIDVETVIEDNPGMSQYSFEQFGHFIVYTQDYQVLLTTLLAEDPITGEQYYYPNEYDYHRLRKLKIDQISINEYESSYWSEYEYRWITDSSIGSNCELGDSSPTNGYCFFYDTTIPDQCMFYAAYLIDNYTINYAYSFSHGDVNEYRTYLDFCDSLGLPTSDQMNEIILG